MHAAAARQKHMLDNPLGDLTDEQLDGAIARLKAEIAAETGMDETELAKTLLKDSSTARCRMTLARK